jgi:predicted kinase
VGECGLVDRTFDKAQFRAAIQYLRRRTLAVVDCEFDADRRVAAVKLSKREGSQ